MATPTVLNETALCTHVEVPSCVLAPNLKLDIVSLSLSTGIFDSPLTPCSKPTHPRISILNRQPLTKQMSHEYPNLFSAFKNSEVVFGGMMEGELGVEGKPLPVYLAFEHIEDNGALDTIPTDREKSKVNLPIHRAVLSISQPTKIFVSLFHDKTTSGPYGRLEAATKGEVCARFRKFKRRASSCHRRTLR